MRSQQFRRLGLQVLALQRARAEADRKRRRPGSPPRKPKKRVRMHAFLSCRQCCDADCMQKEPVRRDSYKPGDLVWAKDRGFPFYPAEVRAALGRGGGGGSWTTL
jgi:hypothetical protein